MEARLIDGHSTIRVDGGGNQLVEDLDKNIIDILPASTTPVRNDPRYLLGPCTLGQMERLAKARFKLHELKADAVHMTLSEQLTRESIALSVLATSEIEGEGFGAHNLQPYVAALTDAGEHVSPDLEARLASHRSILRAYHETLAKTPEPVLTTDFVLETHRMMFETSKPELAGVIKQKEVCIKYSSPQGMKTVNTVPANRAMEMLRSLCERTSKSFDEARKYSTKSMFLTTAEFACDFLAIHPFIDGNGRAARLLTSYLLERGGYNFSRIYPLDQVVLDNRRDYYDALFASQRGWYTATEDLTPWVKFFSFCVFEQWERAFRRVRQASEQGESSL